MTYRPSIAERIAWTSSLRPVDAKVLQALATFADFQTGGGAWPGMAKLMARAVLPKRTIERSLQRLEDEHWITATRRHRRATSYDIRIDRLATNYIGAKVISANYESVRQIGGQGAEFLSATFDGLSAKSGELVRQVGGPTPIPDPDPELSAPTLRVGLWKTDDATTTGTDRAEAKVDQEDHVHQPIRDADVQADDRDHSGRDPAQPHGGLQQSPRGDQAPAPGAGVQLLEQPDPPGALGAGAGDVVGGRVPRGSPTQLTFGPIDVNDSVKKPIDKARLAGLFKDALDRTPPRPTLAEQREQERRARDAKKESHG